uniref:Boule2 n=1 Tax=Enchytraeus coronatus TaxID=208440 RepID=A0AAU7VEV3_9ANNE
MAAADGTSSSGQKEDGPMLTNQAPKYGMLIPSRVFVGGIANNTTESDLRQFFTTYGPIRDCKIIQDRAGVSKGYGFVTFESVDDAEKLMKKEGDHVLFKDRKLNIGPAIRKQQAAARMYDQTAAANAAMLYSAAGLPYAIHPSQLALLQGHAAELNASNQSAQLIVCGRKTNINS